MKKLYKKIAITGGAGYVGSRLVPSLLQDGYDVTVIDTFWYGEGVGDFKRVCGDIRDEELLRRALKGADVVIHLACISNDPSFELNPNLGKSINFDAFSGLLRAVRENNVPRFIYASSSSVYGVKSELNVCETSPCQPLTDYSKYKMMCEDVLNKEGVGDGEYVILRPATVCGHAPRMRFDLTVNILTLHALVNKKIRVFGGSQLRPNIYIQDMVDVYRLLIESPREKIHQKTFNAGFQNRSVRDIADLVKKQIGDEAIEIAAEPTDDMRSYHINSDKIYQELHFKPRHMIEEAVESIVQAYHSGAYQDPMKNPHYYNIRKMQELKIS
ncbi:MAG: UDP-glucose 4-epimerase [Deltaproteobacteria bacterium RIFCSPLOWO2_02_FULL_46_8]|nr:MAG: UDP-glucose 4-epimerase [Deltaproteobacteria bacterium RIFCSPLOWO2_02_FULL_46_8]